MTKFIVHVDMDAFFAAVEQRDDPLCRNKPVVVGSDPKAGKGRGVVSTCSYEARKFGIRSAMPISTAYKLCPHAVFLPVNMEKYEQVSRQVFQIFNEFTPDIEPLGIDEAFLDITSSYHLFGSPAETCHKIKKMIKERTSLTASVGLAPIKMAAKIASDLKKPDGFVEVTAEGLLGFLWPLDIGRMWGVGKKSESVFLKMGIRKIGDIAQRDVNELENIFGTSGRHFWELANGIDDRIVENVSETKSVSNEVTFSEDISDKEKILGSIMELSEKVSQRLRDAGLKGRTITLKIRFTGFETYTRALTIGMATNYTDIIFRTTKSLFEGLTIKKKVRLVGVKVSNFSVQGPSEDLFAGIGDEKREKVHGAIDKIKHKFGDGIIHRARY